MKVLVLGAGGMAGSMIFKYLSQKNLNVIPSFRYNFDVLKDKIPSNIDYDYIINCIGLIKQKTNDCDENLFKINALFPNELAKYYHKVIHLSTDCVFSGSLSQDKSYNTNDIPDALDNYGKSKALGETKNAMILRTSIIGPSNDTSGLFEWFRSTKETPIKGFINHLWSGITTLELAKTIYNIISLNEYRIGIKQIASQKTSKYELLCHINNIFHLHKIIVPYSSEVNINRVLYPDICTKNIKLQLEELSKYMDQ